MKKVVYAIDGTVKETVDVPVDVFPTEVSEGLLYYALNCELANKRQGTACAKTRAEVKGSNRKPWPQKHTGKARSGDVKSPIWRKGGQIFPPRPRDYSYSIPKKAKRNVMCSLVGRWLSQEACKLVEEFTVEDGKTKNLQTILSSWCQKEYSAQIKEEARKYNAQKKYPSTLIIIRDENSMIKRAARNIPWLKFLSYNRLSVHGLLYAQSVLILEEAWEGLKKFYA